MTVTVFFEPPSKAWAEQVATFEDEDVYMACLPMLEALAEQRGCTVTESITTGE
jgi:hypothetical protein